MNSKKPKIALIHDWLNVKVGGAEYVFFELAKLYPEADLFALVCNKKLFRPHLAGRKVHTSFLQILPGFVKRRPFLMLPLVKLAVGSFKLRGYDLVVTNSTAWVKNVTVAKGTKHICYCHSPARMIWDSWPVYLDSQHMGPFRLGPVSRFVITAIVSRLRLWDYYAAKNIDVFLANSRYIASRIQKTYGRSAEVLYPPVQLLQKPEQEDKRGDYYLILSVLSRYKNIELAIEACKTSGRELIIAGEGPDKERLEILARGNKSISFVGYVSPERRTQLMSQAKGFLFPSIEDFGMTPVEAMSVGTPVIALRGGGLAETVIEGKTGLFFETASVDNLNEALTRFESIAWQPTVIIHQAEQFGPRIFEEHLSQIIHTAGVLI